MKAKKKNRFWTFIFSLMPGAGEMYMGFMKMGVSLMGLFFLTLLLPMFFRLDALSLTALIVWFYGFFHANHLAGLADEEFAEVQDGYLLGMGAITGGRNFVQNNQKWVAGALILAGILMLWNTLTDIAYRFLPEYLWMGMRAIGDYAPRVLIAVVIIVLGVKMIQGRKEQLATLSEEEKTKEE